MKTLVRAVRLPFTAACVLPYLFGSMLGRGFDGVSFVLGLVAVVFTHLSANVINDYADSESGVDWQDRRFFGLFGGSKLIQEGVRSASFFRRLGVGLAAVAALAVAGLSIRLRDGLPVVVFVAAAAAAWAYSVGPFKLSYRGAGEAAILVLFGPVPVAAGCYVQGGGLFPATAVFLSLPFGLLTAAILVANEVPDLEDDLRSGKRHLVAMMGAAGGARLYMVLTVAALAVVAAAVAAGLLSAYACVAFVVLAPASRALRIMRRAGADKVRLVESSRLAILSQLIAGAVLTGERFLWPRF